MAFGLTKTNTQAIKCSNDGDCVVGLVNNTCATNSGTCPNGPAGQRYCSFTSFKASNVVCRNSTGACDPAEYCTGNSSTCPADLLAASATVCRNATGVCDIVEYCSGGSATCPVDLINATAPGWRPTGRPTNKPTFRPTLRPTKTPTSSPTRKPSSTPT